MLEKLAPERVFHFFEDICAIPHGSGNTDAISDYCVRFAVEHGFEHTKDSLNNVIIKKPASAGYEAHPTVILQGHLDMVCEKDADLDFDFTKDGLKLTVNGDLVSANGTTLGADDGIAVAMMLAVLEDDSLAHPPIEAVFTVDEETGMYGAQALDVTKLSGSTFINLDSGEEGVLTVGCAGGSKIDIKFPIKTVENKLPCKKIVLSGLLGGHSGVDINKGRQNADKMLGNLLKTLPFEYNLVSINGGFKDNVIPNACECVISCSEDVSKYTESFVQTNKIATDPNLAVSVEDVAVSASRLDAKSTKDIVSFLTTVPFGVTAMSKDIDGLVQSSLNLGIIFTDETSFNAVLSVRSSVLAEKVGMVEDLKKLAESFGADFSTHGDYPAWEYRTNSRLRDTMVSVYEKLCGKTPGIAAVHAGLECGLFNEKIADFDAVSMGPDMWDIHTAKERLSVSSTKRTYDYLCEVLKEL